MARGAIGFVSKPFDENVLLDLVKHAIAHGPRRAPEAARNPAGSEPSP
jgi:FixJ family two-component response regulator